MLHRTRETSGVQRLQKLKAMYIITAQPVKTWYRRQYIYKSQLFSFEGYTCLHVAQRMTHSIVPGLFLLEMSLRTLGPSLSPHLFPQLGPSSPHFSLAGTISGPMLSFYRPSTNFTIMSLDPLFTEKLRSSEPTLWPYIIFVLILVRNFIFVSCSNQPCSVAVIRMSCIW